MQNFREYYEMGTDEYAKHTKKMTPGQDVKEATYRVEIEGEGVATVQARTEKEAEAKSVMPTSSSLSESLEQKGYAILEALEFTKGSAELRAGAHTSLAELSNFLKANPDQKIVLVGHTDNSGSLENNLKLSKQRAQSVLDRLIKNYGIESDRLSAEGVGFLSPQTSNKGQKGREINRRVEVILSN